MPAGTNSRNGGKNVSAITQTHSQAPRAHAFQMLPVGNTNSISANNGHQGAVEEEQGDGQARMRKPVDKVLEHDE